MFFLPTNVRKVFSDKSLICSFLFILAFTFSALALQASAYPITQIEDFDGDDFNDVKIETDLLKVIISSKTGSPSLYYLKGRNFEENIYPPQLIEMGYNIDEQTRKPFTTTVVGQQVNRNGYRVSIEEKTENSVVVKATANSTWCETEDEQSISFSKIYTFTNGQYYFDIEYVVTNLKERLIAVGDEQKGSISLNYGPGLFLDPFAARNILALRPLEVESYNNAESFTKGVFAGGYNGVGLRDQYFCILLESPDGVGISATEFKIQPGSPSLSEETGHIIQLTRPTFNLGAREHRTFSYRVYAGPILVDQLEAIGREGVSDYGFLSTILLRLLQTFYTLYPNYGLAIILLTLLIRVALYPLTLKQTKSMAQMRVIQPEVKKLKERYKDNSQKFNEEVLKLYQTHNVNPLGGCLPLLMQLPILIALYNTLRIAVELRKTPFLWLPDLSKSDPLILLPIAIALLMYYQQNEMGGDPQQQQMMAFMPMIMFAITWTLPSGLLMYWFASSIIGLFQQLQANKIVRNAPDKVPQKEEYQREYNKNN